MKKLTGFLTALLLLASVSLAYGDAETIGGVTINPNLLIKATDCSPFIMEGVPCWDTDDDDLYVGDGTAALLVGGGSGVADGDYGQISITGGVWSVDDDVIDADNLADGDYGEVSISGGVISLDADVVDDTNVDWGTGANQVSAADVPVDATGFSGQLSGTDTDVQTALGTLDNLVIVSGTPVDNELCSYDAGGGGIDCEAGWVGAVREYDDGSYVDNWYLHPATNAAWTTGDYNYVWGDAAGDRLNTGSDNIAIGKNALGYASGADGNIAIGTNAGALFNNNPGNIAIGYQANDANYFDTGSISIGYQAGTNITSDGHNLLIGYRAGDNLVNLSNYNLIIGYDADSQGGASGDNFLNIGNGLWGSGFQSATGTTIGDAKVGIGDTSPDAMLDIVAYDANDIILNLEMKATPAASPFCVNTTGVSTCDVFELDEAGYIHQTSTQTTGHVYEIDTATITSGNIFDINHTTAAGTGNVFYVDMADGSGTFTGDFIEFYVNSAERFAVGYRGDVDINSQMTGGNVFDVTETTGTGGNTFSVEHSTSAKTGNVYAANMASGSGSFTGDFANFQVNNVEKFVVDASGNVDAQGEVVGGLKTVSVAASCTVGTDCDGTSDDVQRGGVVYVTSAATVTLRAVEDGDHITVITIGAIAVSVDVNASDKMYLDGTLLDDGDKATNTSTTGDKITCMYYSADGFYCTSSTNAGGQWSDGGA